MKLVREQEIYELDIRYASGKVLYQRDFSRAGIWTKSGSRIHTNSFAGSLQTRKRTLFSRTAMKIVRFLKNRAVSDFRVIVRCESRKVHFRKKQQNVKESIYIEIAGPQGFTFLTPLAELNFKNLDHLLSEHRSYFLKPFTSANIHFDSLILNPAVFGYFLHEGLGHRQESDDHSNSLMLQNLPRTNFSVLDGPGNEKMLGYTPFDDYGIAGQNVTLLHGPSGQTQLLSAQTGNSRATSYEFHPLIRQRCLIVEIHQPVEAPSLKNSLCLEEVLHGRWDGETLELDITKATYTNSLSKELRLSPFTLRMKPESVCSMRAFGKNEISHPAGGCHKGLQRGLDVGFDTPSAYLPLNGHKNIASLLEFLF